MTTVGIFGFTGHAGRGIAAQALKRGLRVIGIARHPERSELAGIDARAGSITDETLVAQVFDEADVVIVAVKATFADETRLADRVLPVLVREATRTGTRLGIVGGAGSLFAFEGGPLFRDTMTFPKEPPKGVSPNESVNSGATLDYLREHGGESDWFYVSPGAEFSITRGELGRYRIGGDVMLKDADGRSRISSEDLGLAFVDEIVEPKHHRTRFSVAY